MRTKVLIIFGLSAALLHGAEVADTVSLPEVEVSVSRIVSSGSKAQMQVSVIDRRMIDETQTTTPKELSSFAPNIYMPDYGSAMTSSIYIRGLGSRINEPVMGMVIDGVPLLDKNIYDHTMQDVTRIELLRGPQGSLYGRNSPGGVMEIRTIRPLDLTTQLVKARLSANAVGFDGWTEHAQVSLYRPENERFGWGIAARYKHTDGFYVNEYTGKKIDFGQQAGGRIVMDGKPNEAWRVTGTVNADWVSQGAFPYASAETGRIAYNREAGYERLAVLPALRATYTHDDYTMQLAASYQYMRDHMRMDQDYTTADIFTLEQIQRQHNGTADVLFSSLTPSSGVLSHYTWQAGASAFTKNNRMTAPVTFMREGIETIILGNANRGIQTVFPDDSIDISNPTLPIPSSFGLYNAGIAVYHQSHFYFGHWHLNAGLRIDYEYAQMDYLSTADLDYRFTMIMSDYEHVHTEIGGVRRAHYFQVLPRVALSYENEWVTAYGYVAKGYKAGGFNPQIFSTITQNQVMTDMAASMGMHLDMADPRFSDVAITEYKPEKDWSFELGAHFTPLAGLQIDVDAFHIQCFDQQVTVFPNGKTTGRMMANAARSRVWGVETALRYRWSEGQWSGMADASYGFTDARFIEFNDGMGNYAGHYIPYAPAHTLHAFASARYAVEKKGLQAVGFNVRLNMTGPVYWNEQNDRVQTPYALLSAGVQLEWPYVRLQVWGRNITNTRYDVFYFRSMEHDFLQRGRPVELGATVAVEL